MFRIGEFSKIARVPASLLRYYDDIGLFKPIKSDRDTGYRYYSVRQLTQQQSKLVCGDYWDWHHAICIILEHDLEIKAIAIFID